MMRDGNAIAGIYDHWGWAVVVCVAKNKVIDRRRIVLIEPGVPSYPHHHDAQTLPIAEAEALIERVSASARVCARAALAELPASVGAIAMRKRPKLPATVAERITDYRAQNVADSVMYRDAIAHAAESLGLRVSEYDAGKVFNEAAAGLGVADISEFMKEIGKSLGSPWDKDHRIAAAAAIAANGRSLKV